MEKSLFVGLLLYKYVFVVPPAAPSAAKKKAPPSAPGAIKKAPPPAPGKKGKQKTI